MSNIIHIENYIPHHPFEAMCMACFHRWIAVVPDETVLKTVACENCGPGYVIDTGQYISLDRYDLTRGYVDHTVSNPEPGDAA